MSPMERVRERSEAFELLGLDPSAAADEIRAAWRRRAFEVHPDRNGGDYGAFMRLKAAYDLIRDASEAGATCAAPGQRGFRTGARTPTGARPRVTTRRSPLTEEALAACRALLAGPDEDAEACAAGAGAVAAEHVPDAVERHGRDLTYLVATPLEEGLNRIALPTALLEDNRRVKPRTMTVRAARSGAGEVSIPDRKRARMFPGARSVRIRFGSA